VADILILTQGSRGDVQPYVALGAALADRGHRVTVSTGQGFEELITQHGLSAAPLSVDMQAMMDSPEIKAAMKSVSGWFKAFRSSQDLMQGQLDEMWSVAQQVAPEIIVYNPKAFIAPYLARAIGAIAVPSFLQPAFVATGSFPNPLLRLPNLGRFGNRLSGRAMSGLMGLGYGMLLRKWLPRHPEVVARPSLSAVDGYHPQDRPVPRLHAHSNHLVPKPPDWGDDDHVTGYWFLPQRQAFEPPEELAGFLEEGTPPVYAGFGSMPSGDADRTASVVVEALRETRTRAVLAKGWGALSAAASSKDIHVVDSAPHEWLFPRCSAVIHHGGAGTTHEGLRWGRPTLVCPVFGDQPFWGHVIEKMAAGPAPVALNKLSVECLVEALRELRSGPIQDKAASLGKLIQSEGGAVAAADLIEAA
jgi:sterol 3beta-glucosyltransferase